MRSAVWLIGGALGLWLVALYPGWLLAGDLAIVQSGVAMLLCLLPALATLAWALKAGAFPETHLLATLGGSALRIVTVPAAACVFYLGWPEVFTDNFWIWIALFYLVLLALETTLLVRNRREGAIS